MMETLMARGETAAQRARAGRIEAIAQAVAAQVPGVHTDTSTEEIVLTGRGLLRRWLTDPALRFIGRLD